jgi:hypothetical protein
MAMDAARFTKYAYLRRKERGKRRGGRGGGRREGGRRKKRGNVNSLVLV